MKEINSSNGWDGTYNTKEMPEIDYWYKIILQNGKSTFWAFLFNTLKPTT